MTSPGPPSFPGSTLFIGCGTMAGAMVEGWRKAGVDLSRAKAVRPSGKPVEGVETETWIPPIGEPALVMLGFKPQQLDSLATEVELIVGGGTTLLSILAGVEIASLRARFPRAERIVRVMPNLPVSEGQGVLALMGDKPVGDLVPLFAPLGMVHIADSEEDLAAIGALAGAGPAYVARFVAAMAKAGEKRGLDSELAAAIALHTVHGTAAMAKARNEPMDEVARRVASPNGTTEAGLKVLDTDRALDDLVERTLDAAATRGSELAEAARRG